MNNGRRNFVCFTCRTSRRSRLFSQPLCQHCGQKMTHAGSKCRVPKKKDGVGWTRLQTWIEDLKKRGFGVG